MTSFFKYLLPISFLLLLTTSASAGGWVQKKGGGFFKLSQWWVIADQHFTDQGLIDPNTTNGIFNTSIYGEYGFSERFTGIAYVPLFSRAYFNNTVSGTTGEVLTPGEAINSFGDVDVSLKYGLVTKGPIAVSATLLLGLPLGNASGGTAGNLQTGDGEFNQLLQIDAGKGFKVGKLDAYANAYVGFNNRTNGFSDEVRYGVEGGLTFLNKKVTGILRLYGVQSLKNGESTGVNSTSIFANNSQHLTLSPEINYHLTDRLGASFTYGTALAGQIIFANPSYSVGVFFKL